MKTNKPIQGLLWGVVILLVHSCSIPQVVTKQVDSSLPATYQNTLPDTVDVAAQMNWKDFFDDPLLTQLIDSAMVYNQEMNILLQRISYARNEVQARKGEYLPFVNAGLGTEVEKVGRFTRNGAVEQNLEIVEGEEIPELLGNFQFGLYASWELDVWKKQFPEGSLHGIPGQH